MIEKSEDVSLGDIKRLIEDLGKKTDKQIKELREETDKQIKELRERIESEEYDRNSGFEPDTRSSFGYARPNFGRSGMVFREIELSRAEKEIFDIVAELWEKNGEGITAGQVRERDSKKRSLNLISHYLYKMYQYGYLDRNEGRNYVYYRPRENP